MKKRCYSNTDRLQKMKEEEIDFSDCPEMDEKFLEQALIILPEKKETVTIRLDKEVLEWFRAQGKGYQTKINALLRSYIRAHPLESQGKE